MSVGACVAKEWLLCGLDLWQGTELGFARDYLLCLPNPNFSGSCGKKARYSDAQGFSKSLLALLLKGKWSEEPRLLTEAVSFWSEHSDRAGLDSWLASLSVGSDLRRFMGALGAEGRTHARTHARTRAPGRNNN